MKISSTAIKVSAFWSLVSHHKNCVVCSMCQSFHFECRCWMKTRWVTCFWLDNQWVFLVFLVEHGLNHPGKSFYPTYLHRPNWISQNKVSEPDFYFIYLFIFKVITKTSTVKTDSDSVDCWNICPKLSKRVATAAPNRSGPFIYSCHNKCDI